VLLAAGIGVADGATGVFVAAGTGVFVGMFGVCVGVRVGVNSGTAVAGTPNAFVAVGSSVGSGVLVNIGVLLATVVASPPPPSTVVAVVVGGGTVAVGAANGFVGASTYAIVPTQ
jgi:hypothetical protein